MSPLGHARGLELVIFLGEAHYQVRRQPCCRKGGRARKRRTPVLVGVKSIATRTLSRVAFSNFNSMCRRASAAYGSPLLQNVQLNWHSFEQRTTHRRRRY